MADWLTNVEEGARAPLCLFLEDSIVTCELFLISGKLKSMWSLVKKCIFPSFLGRGSSIPRKKAGGGTAVW